jgi:hypothetical protein
MDPLAPALAEMTNVLSLKATLTEVLEFMVTLQVGLVPEHRPDQPANAELALGAALRVTTVPASKSAPAGTLATVLVPVPLLLIFKGYRAGPI